MDRKLAFFFLNQLTAFPHEKLEKMADLAGDPEELFRTGPEELLQAGLLLSLAERAQYEEYRNEEKLSRLYEETERKGIRYVTREEDGYPSKLSDIEDAPFGLFLLGPSPDWDLPGAGIVGSRRCTSYGREMASFFGRELAKRGLLIVSGMALGVDGYAGRGALSAHGKHAAVLASGADVCYPRENIDLYAALKEQGVVVSERPLGRQAMPYDFPIRNRIISGLSDVLLIIEAAPNSGSLITAELANRQGREVFALPGRAGDRMSEGTNRLIRDGAQILLSPEDVLQRLGLQVGRDTVKRPGFRLSGLDKLLYDEMGATPLEIETLHRRTGIPFTVLPEILISLEIKGLIKKEAAGGYTRVV